MLAGQPDLDNPSLMVPYHMIRECITLPIKTTSDRGLISRIYREFKHLKKKKINNTISKPIKQTSNESEKRKCKWPINKWKK